jgi:peroxiredoxin
LSGNDKNSMKIIRLLLVCFVLTTLVSHSIAQSKYSIKLNISGLNDSTLILASYVGDKQFVIDTAYADKKLNYHFEGDSLLPAGMYIIVSSNKKKLFDFIISGNHKFTITGDAGNLPASLRSKDSEENSIFFGYINFLADKQQVMSELQSKRKQLKAGSAEHKKITAGIDSLNNLVVSYINGLINQHQGKFISVFLKSMQEPERPETPILPNGRPDSIFAFNHYKKHYFDNIDLSDDRVIRTPILHSKVEQYIANLTSPAPDSIIASIDKLMAMTRNNRESFKYLIWYFTIKYESSEIMGHDAIVVHIVDKYYDDPRMSWMNPTVKENLIKRANTLRPILIGKKAPELILFDTLQNPRSLHSIKNKYTIMYFWDPDCGHCKKETPSLTAFYKEFKDIYNLEVYAICMDTSWKEMKSYIQKNNMNWINVNGYFSMSGDFRELYDVHSSPVMYLIDEQKKIIAKRVLTEQMKAILQRLYQEK